MKRASILLGTLMILVALPALAAEPAAPAQQPAAVTLAQILGGQSCAAPTVAEAAVPTVAAAANWNPCYPSISCRVNNDCHAWCGDPTNTFGYCWNGCCTCLG